ncbi:MAG: SDR family NAD(P)-dependent oxidoreductase, partial [Spongiibacter sp.]
MQTDQQFKDKYGPWALIVGASHGTGAACAHQLAAKGLNCVLIARNASAMAELAEQLAGQYGVESKVIATDLSSPDGPAGVCQQLDGLDIGLLVYNAGAPAYASTFLNAPLQDWQ